VIAKRLQVERRGRARGARELPQTAEQQFDPVEREIVDELIKEWSWQQDALLGQLRAYHDRLAQLSVSSELGQLRLAAENAKASFTNANVQAAAELGPRQEAFHEAREELLHFRQKHLLARPARPSASGLFTVSLLFFLIAVESILNGIFFSKGSEYGLLGGIGVALGISFFNVCSAFLLGAGPARWLHARNLLLRTLGLVLSVAGWGGLFLLHGFAAHFRDISGRVPESQTFEQAVMAVLSSPLRLMDVNSYYLFGLGLLLALAAFLKGYYSDDPYPGYGKIHRRFVEYRDAYNELHSQFFGELTEIKDALVNRIEHVLRRIPANVAMAEQVRAARAQLVGRFLGYEQDLEGAVNRILTIYRDTNRDARQTAAPSHFGSSWALAQRATEAPAAIALRADPEDVSRDQMDKILTELREMSADVMRRYESMLASFPHPTTIK
jgi:hypothetical protein